MVKTWWSVEDFNHTVNPLYNCWECNKPGHVRIECPVIGQPRLTYSEEDLNYTVNPLGHCWKCNQPGHVMINCPKLGRSRTSNRRRKEEDVCCYNCKEYGHYARNCRLPKRTRKEQRCPRVKDKVKFTDEEKWMIQKIYEGSWEKKVKPSENKDIPEKKEMKTSLLSHIRELQHRVNNLGKEKPRSLAYAKFKMRQRNIFGLALVNSGNLASEKAI